MSKKITLLLMGFIFLSHFHSANATLVINEIMYDLEGTDTGREWVEVYNDSDTAADLSAFKFFEANTNHELDAYEGNANTGAQGYAVIVSDPVKFKIDWPSFSGAIFDSSFSLSNDGEALAIKDGNLNAVDQYAYSSATGAAGNGKSLQKIEGIWIGATPTPGVTNETITPPLSGGDGGSDNTSAGGGSNTSSTPSIASETTSKIAEPRKIKTQITAKTLAFTGIPLLFEGMAFGYNGEQLYNNGRYFWNFGDGDSKEVKMSNSQKFTHTYFYGGEYVVFLEYYSNYYGDVPDASDKMIIKVVPADILISNVGDEKDFFVELSNNTNYDADISKWILAADNHSFVFPKNTILGSKKKIIFSSKIISFSISDKNNLKLLNPQGGLVFDYSSSQITPKSPPLDPLLMEEGRSSSPPAKGKMLKAEGVNSDAPNEQVPAPNLPASAIQSGVIEDNSDSLYTMIVSFLSFVFIGTSASAVYFLRQKKIKKDIMSNTGSDFEILDQ